MRKKKQKLIKRNTDHIELQPGVEKRDAFVGVVNGQVTLVDPRSGIANEDLINGYVDEAKLEGLSENEKEEYLENFEQKLDDDLFGNTANAYTNRVEDT